MDQAAEVIRIHRGIPEARRVTGEQSGTPCRAKISLWHLRRYPILPVSQMMKQHDLGLVMSNWLRQLH